MTPEEELRAMEAAIEAENANQASLGLDNAPEPSAEEIQEPVQPEQIEESEDATPEPAPENEPEPLHSNIEIPEGLPEEYHDAFIKEATRRSDAIISKNRQKDKQELEKIKKSLRAEDIVGEHAPQVQQTKTKTYDEIMSDIPEESREELKPLLDKMKELTESQVADLRHMQQQQLAAQRHQIEKDHFNELLGKYNGFKFTQDMFSEAKQLQRSYPQYSIAQIVEQKHANELNDFVVEQKVKAAIEKMKNEPAEHPGGNVNGTSPSRSKSKPNLENMSLEESVKWLESNLPKAHDFTATNTFRR